MEPSSNHEQDLDIKYIHVQWFNISLMILIILYLAYLPYSMSWITTYYQGATFTIPSADFFLYDPGNYNVSGITMTPPINGNCSWPKYPPGPLLPRPIDIPEYLEKVDSTIVIFEESQVAQGGCENYSNVKIDFVI